MNKILELLDKDDTLLCSVFWKKSFTEAINELNNPKSKIAKMIGQPEIKWILETEEKSMQFLGLLPSGEVVTLNDDTEVEGLADNLALVSYIILLYNLDNDYSIENIKRTYIQQGMTNYIENMVKYTQMV